MQDLITSWRFWGLWALAFLGFPLAGVLAQLGGAVNTTGRAVVAGAIAGVVLGGVQWLVLRQRLELPLTWVLASSIGLAISLGLSTAILGSETAGNELLGRALISGLGLGVAQWLVLRGLVPNAAVWIGVVGVGWAVGWYITRAVGVDLSPKWAVFGSTGAWAFQLLTSLPLYFWLSSRG